VLTFVLGIVERLVADEDPAPHLANAKKILIVDPAFIGDMVWSTPAYRAVKEHAGRPEIHAMIFPPGRDVFRHNPYCDDVRIIPRKSFIGQFMAILPLRREKYDVIVNLFTGLRMNFYCRIIGAPLRAGYNYRHRGCFHNCRVPIATRTVRTIYRPEECLLLLEKAFGWKILHRDMVFEVPQEACASAADLLGKLGCGPGDRLVGIHPNSNSRHEEKRWTVDNFARLADHLVRAYGVKVVLTGSGADSGYVGEILSRVRNRNMVVSTVGELTLSELGALLQRCSLFVSVDTGPLHISIAVKTPTFGLIGGVPLDLVIPHGNPRYRGIAAGRNSKEGLDSLRDLAVETVSDRIAGMDRELHLFAPAGR